MRILGWPGPKGQLFLDHASKPLFFDNTLELLAYALQPEYRQHIHQIYVQDMSLANWDQPDEAPWIDARHAWFVLGHTRMGSMGPTLASFAEQQAALQFVEHYQGEVLAYSDITLEHLLRLAGQADGTAPANTDDHGHEHGHQH
jgi:copper chaperone NosL